MATPYFDSFTNPFLALRMSRPAYKAQAAYCHAAIEAAKLGAAFTPLLAALATALAGFDENLVDRGQSTAGTTGSYHAARTAWLAFVEDTAIDYVKPKLRKLPAFADFQPYGKSRLKALRQPDLLVKSGELLQLYATHQKALSYPALHAEAAALLQAVAAADEQQDQQASTIDTARLALAGDRAAIAQAQRRLKAQLELKFDEPEKVYSFFDFSDSKAAKKSTKNAAKKPE